ncbi:nitroreductase family deazaflavin-dependent oxidoreductase [Mycobacterium sp. MBM]|nr:nitroreductase family deazaflavin-dependent oxidoreductase [Mycobacterium sp. MBM]
MSSRVFDNPVARALNRGAVALTALPVLGNLVGRGLVEIRYTGRKSGRTIRTPVNYRLEGDRVAIAVMSPDAKSWWRNFLGDGAPITLLNFRGRDRDGHAVATRDDRGRVRVVVDLT